MIAEQERKFELDIADDSIAVVAENILKKCNFNFKIYKENSQHMPFELVAEES